METATFWTKDGKFLVNDTGNFIICSECPCAEGEKYLYYRAVYKKPIESTGSSCGISYDSVDGSLHSVVRCRVSVAAGDSHKYQMISPISGELIYFSNISEVARLSGSTETPGTGEKTYELMSQKFLGPEKTVKGTSVTINYSKQFAEDVDHVSVSILQCSYVDDDIGQAYHEWELMEHERIFLSTSGLLSAVVNGTRCYTGGTWGSCEHPISIQYTLFDEDELVISHVYGLYDPINNPVIFERKDIGSSAFIALYVYGAARCVGTKKETNYTYQFPNDGSDILTFDGGTGEADTLPEFVD